MSIYMLINVKMPTIVGILTFMSMMNFIFTFMSMINFILTFMSMINFMLSWLEHEQKFYNLGGLDESSKFKGWN